MEASTKIVVGIFPALDCRNFGSLAVGQTPFEALFIYLKTSITKQISAVAEFDHSLHKNKQFLINWAPLVAWTWSVGD